MRDLALFGLLAWLVVQSFRRPFYGGLGWVLFSVMYPHRLTFSRAYDFPFAMIMAVVTLVSLLVGREPKRPKGGKAVWVLVALLAWCAVTTLSAFHPDRAETYLLGVSKTILMALVLLLTINSKRDIVMLVAVLALSLGFYGTKGGVFVLTTGGQYMVNGPADSLMDGNNALGVGLTMCIPLIYFLIQQTRHKWLRWGLTLSIVLCAISVVGSYSRGALLAIASMSVLLWLRSRNKVVIALVAAGFLVVAIPSMPEQWFARMSTMTKSAEEDTSAMGRIYAWRTATNIAVDRFPLAGGFEWNGPDTSLKYSPDPSQTFVAHSVYFQVIGSQGFVGLALFLVFWMMVYRQCMWLRKQCRKLPEHQWAHSLASMVQVSLVGYAVGGAFLDMAFWDLPYYLYVAVAGTQYIVRQQLAAAERQAAAPSGKKADGGLPSPAQAGSAGLSRS